MPTPSHNPVPASAQVPVDTKTALTIYALKFLNRYREIPAPRIVQVGFEDTSPALTYGLPVSIGAPSWAPTVNGIKFRETGSVSLPVNVINFSDGVRAKADAIESITWSGWGDEPKRVAQAAKLIGEQALVALLETGESMDSIENYVNGVTGTGIKIFATGKKADLLGGGSKTYDNYFPNTPLTLANIDKIAAKGKTIPNGNAGFRRMKWRYVIVGGDIADLARRYFDSTRTDNLTIAESSGNTEKADVVKPNSARSRGIEVLESSFLSKTPGAWYPVFVDEGDETAPWVTITKVPVNQGQLIASSAPPPPTPNGVDPAAGIRWHIHDRGSHFNTFGADGVEGAGWVAIAAETSVGAGIVAPWGIFKCFPGATP